MYLGDFGLIRDTVDEVKRLLAIFDQISGEDKSGNEDRSKDH